MDLMKLDKELKEGVRIPRDDGRAVIVTPLCRFDFPNLVKPRAPKDRPNDLQYGVVLIWNWANADQPALVDLKAVVAPAISEVAKAHGLTAKGWLRSGDEPKKQLDDGSYAEGYGPGMMFVSCNRKLTTKAGNELPAPVVRDGRKAIIDPGLVKAGYYGRVVASIYHVPHGGGKVCMGLEEVQLLAKGELLGGGGGTGFDYSDALGTVQGDTFDGDTKLSGQATQGPSIDDMFD